MHSSLFLDKSHMAFFIFFNLLYHIYDVIIYQCKSNKRKAAFQLRLQTHWSQAAPTSGSYSQLSTLTFSLSSCDVKNMWFKSLVKVEKPPRHLSQIPTQQQNRTQEKLISLQKPPRAITSGTSYLLVLSKYRGSPLPKQHLHRAAWFNINMPLDPQLKATAWRQN